MQHRTTILVDKGGFLRCTAAPHFGWNVSRGITFELLMDDMHGAGTPSVRKQFIEDLSREIEFKGGDARLLEQPSKHLERQRTTLKNETRLQPNKKYLDTVAHQLELTTAQPASSPRATSHRATMNATPQLTAAQTSLYRSCVDALSSYVMDRANAQIEVSFGWVHI